MRFLVLALGLSAIAACREESGEISTPISHQSEKDKKPQSTDSEDSTFPTNEESPNPEDQKEDADAEQKTLKREFDRTFNRVKSQYQRASNKRKFQFGDSTYEGETAEGFDRYMANGIGKVTNLSGSFVITTFHLGDNKIAAEGIFSNPGDNVLCAGLIQELHVVATAICLKNGKYERQLD